MSDALDPSVIRLAEILASRIVGANSTYTRDDWEDLRQELLVDYVRRQARYDPARGHQRGFVSAVLRNHMAKLAAASNRARIDSALPHSIPDQSTYATSLIESELQLHIDVQKVLAQLPDHLRTLAIQLAHGMSPMEVCRESGISRSCIYRWIHRIRCAFDAAGIR